MKKFSDIDLNLKAHPTTGDVVIRYDDDAVKRSIVNLILTNTFERPFQSSIGTDIRRSLFENFTISTKYLLEKRIKTTIELYEPRVKIQTINIVEKPDDNALSVEITYQIIGTRDRIVETIIPLRRLR